MIKNTMENWSWQPDMTDQHQVQLSPLQMKQLIFTKIIVELADSLEKTSELWAPSFDMNGVIVLTEISTAMPDDQIANPVNFMVTMRLAILNEKEGSKKAPYKIDIAAQAWFEISSGIEIGKREDLVRVNGASLIMGAIRELVIQLTSRSGFGALTLPTLRFMPATQENNPAQSK